MKAEDIENMINLNTIDDLKEYAKENGYDDKSIKDIFGK